MIGQSREGVFESESTAVCIRFITMTAVTLYRIDSAKRVQRYCRMDVQPDLFGEWCLLREWGRIGSTGQMRSLPNGNQVNSSFGRVGSAANPQYIQFAARIKF